MKILMTIMIQNRRKLHQKEMLQIPILPTLIPTRKATKMTSLPPAIMPQHANADESQDDAVDDVEEEEDIDKLAEERFNQKLRIQTRMNQTRMNQTRMNQTRMNQTRMNQTRISLISRINMSFKFQVSSFKFQDPGSRYLVFSLVT